jgi:hypothetical protein
MANVVQIIINGANTSDRAFASAKTNLIGLQNVAKTAGIAFAALAVAAGASAAGAILDFTREAINTADEMGQLAQKTGTAVEDFSRLSYVANLAEVDSGQLKAAIKSFSDELGKAGKNSANVVDELLAVADEFANMEDGVAKTNRAVQLFGKSGQDIIPLLNQGSQAIREQMQEAERFGLVIGGDFARNADQFNDNLTRLQSAFKGIWLQVAEQNLPSLIELSETLLHIANNGEVLTKVIDAISHSLYISTVAARAFLDPLKSMKDLIEEDFGKSIVGSMSRDVRKAFGAGDNAKTKIAIDPEDVERAIKLQEQLQLTREQGGERLRETERLNFEKTLEQIEKLKIAEADKIELRLNAEMAYQDRLTEIKVTGEEARAELDDRMRRGDVERYLLSLRTVEGAEIASLEGRKQFLQAFTDIWMESHRTMFSYVAQAAQTVYQGLSNAIANVITGTQTAAAAFKQLGLQMVQMVVNWMAQRLVAFALEKSLAVAGIALARAQHAATLASAASLAGAWGAAATAASIATLGAASAFGALVPPAMAANAALGSSLALAAGAVGGIAHGGLDYVPQEATYLLNRGERVVQPEQNRDLTEFLSGGSGGRSMRVTINLDGRALWEGIGDASRDGRLIIDANAIV